MDWGPVSWARVLRCVIMNLMFQAVGGSGDDDAATAWHWEEQINLDFAYCTAPTATPGIGDVSDFRKDQLDIRHGGGDCPPVAEIDGSTRDHKARLPSTRDCIYASLNGIALTRVVLLFMEDVPDDTDLSEVPAPEGMSVWNLSDELSSCCMTGVDWSTSHG